MAGHTAALDRGTIFPIWAPLELPFHIGYQPMAHNESAPDVFPFEAGFDTALGLIVQTLSPELVEALSTAYRCGSQICASMGDEGLGRIYAEDFESFIHQSLGAAKVKGRRVLEIGCGRGWLLRRLAEQGAVVEGVEPGLESTRHADEAGLPIHRRPFEECEFAAPFDVILHYAVLEHVFDPAAFIAPQLELLKPGGRLIFSVPDCTEHVLRGDLSMFVHEHISYFTHESLARLAESVGANVTTSRAAGRGGAIYSVWTRGVRPEPARRPPRRLVGRHRFVEMAEQNLVRLREFLTPLCSKGQTLGVFCPGRFFNYHYLLRDVAPRVRYFDDNTPSQGMYYPPIDVPIESRAELLSDPPDALLIMSRSFGREIREQLRTLPEMKSCKITMIEELF